MQYKTLYSTKSTTKEAVADLKSQLAGFKTSMILFFASSCFEPSGLSQQMQQAFGNIPHFGCTTAGEITSGQMLDQSIVAMAFSDQVIGQVHAKVLTHIREDDQAVEKAFASFEKHLGAKMQQLDPAAYVGLVFIDGVSGAEERINERIGDLTNVTFIGGSAGDDLQFKSTYVYAHGEAYSDAALLVLIKPLVPFSVLKTQSFRPTGKVLTVTQSDESKREIIEFNHQPATRAYAQALGVPEAALSQYLFKNPLGLMFDEQTPFVRSPRIIENQRILFYCSVKAGMELMLLESTDIVADTAKALADKQREMGLVSAILNFNCILRTLDLKQQQRSADYGALFKAVPTVGFSTYGESYIGHINQTATMLVFG